MTALLLHALLLAGWTSAQATPAKPDCSGALALADLPAAEQSGLAALGALASCAPDAQGRRPVYDPRTGDALTREAIARLLAGPPPAKPPAAAAPGSLHRSAALETLKKGGVFASALGPLPDGYPDSARPDVPDAGVQVLKNGDSRVGAAFDASNYLTVVPGLKQKFETHAVTLDYARGVPLGQVGVTVRAAESDIGFMNGFISLSEKFMSLFGGQQMINSWRTGPRAVTGTVDTGEVAGRSFHGDGVFPLGLTDVSFNAKRTLDVLPASWATSLAARASVNIATGHIFPTPDTAGVGLSAQRRLSNRLYAQADARAIVPLSSQDRMGVPVKKISFGGTGGLEVRTAPRTSFVTQVDMEGSPYQTTGNIAYDATFAALRFGVEHSTRLGEVAVYGKEDFNVNNNGLGRMAPYGNSDWLFGIKLTRLKRKAP